MSTLIGKHAWIFYQWYAVATLGIPVHDLGASRGIGRELTQGLMNSFTYRPVGQEGCPLKSEGPENVGKEDPYDCGGRNPPQNDR